MNTEIVFRNESGVAVTTSLLVAETFKKNHKEVLRDIDNLFVSAQNCAQTENQGVTEMFFRTEYESPLNNGTSAVRKNPMYTMNRDGFTLLVMGYTGQKALEFKLKYISAFNAMERSIQQGAMLSQQFMETQMQMMSQMMTLCNTMMQRIERMESVSQPATEKPAPMEAVTKEEVQMQPVFQPTKYGRYVMGLYDVRMFYPSYMKVYDAAVVLRSRGLAVYQKSLFSYLRKKGYICTVPDRYNRPSEECEKNGWMVSTWAGTKVRRYPGRRTYVPYLSPDFVSILEDCIRKDIFGAGLPFGREVKE